MEGAEAEVPRKTISNKGISGKAKVNVKGFYRKALPQCADCIGLHAARAFNPHPLYWLALAIRVNGG
jgi:hypothetical protein